MASSGFDLGQFAIFSNHKAFEGVATFRPTRIVKNEKKHWLHPKKNSAT